MNKNLRYEGKIGKRIISAALAMIFSLTAAPMECIPEEAGKLIDYAMTAQLRRPSC